MSHKLRVPEARILKSLMPDPVDLPKIDWPMYTRSVLVHRAGYSPISGTINRVFYGIPEGSSSGEPHPGLIQLGMVEIVELDISGVSENNYRITKKGIIAFQSYIKRYGDKLPPLRDPAICTNDRYLKEE